MKGFGIVYLAGACDAVSLAESRDWREVAQADLRSSGISTYSPPHAFVINTDDVFACEGLQIINNMALATSVAVLANLSGKSFGTPLELQLADELGIPVFGFEGPSQSIYRFEYETWAESYPVARDFLIQRVTSDASDRVAV